MKLAKEAYCATSILPRAAKNDGVRLPSRVQQIAQSGSEIFISPAKLTLCAARETIYLRKVGCHDDSHQQHLEQYHSSPEILTSGVSFAYHPQIERPEQGFFRLTA